VENEKRHRSEEAKVPDKLSLYGLDEIRYWLNATHEKFDVVKFRAALGESEEKYCSAVFAGNDPSLEYGLRIAVWDEEEVTIQLTYWTIQSGKKKRTVALTEPSIEEFGTWLGQFFKHETTHTHMHGHFSYPLASRASKFPLPLKTSIEDAQIDGFSLMLPSEPEGVGRVRITQGDEEWYVEVVADRRMSFRGFTPHLDVKALASVVNAFLEKRK
jgi:hypothetical protein